VLDLYVESVDDSLAPTRYRLDGGWRPIEQQVQVYRGPDGDTIAVDTTRLTHRGPLRRQGTRWVSLRWTVLEPSSELDVFARAATATTALEWLDAMRDYQVPTQNGLVADREGTIAIRSSGWYPVRAQGRGDTLLDGTRSAGDWIGRLPVEQYPFAIRPSQGFLASANQQPVDPRDNGAYLGGNWPSPFRAIHINQLLQSERRMTPDGMRRMQTDPRSARAAAFLPLLLAGGRAARGAAPDSRLERALQLLGEWDGTYRPDNQRTILFELALRELPGRIWDELIPPGAPNARPVHFTSVTLSQALHDTAGIWWDDRRTPARQERWTDIVGQSLAAALDTAMTRYGHPDSGGWRWGRVWPTHIMHLLRLRPLSATGIEVQGGPETLAPAGREGEYGASWRMVVELGPELLVWATYPGGQSGNPASPFYANRVTQWARGELDSVLTPRAPDALPAHRVRSRISFQSGEP
jgi:penicillin amidase